MSFYNNEADYRTRGIDYDLVACLENNPQDGFSDRDIAKVLAVWEGQNDGDDWRWVLHLKDGRYVFLQGGCDYTGWDCQSFAISTFADSAESAAHCALGDIPATVSPADAGLGHLIDMLGGNYMSNIQTVYESLMKQLKEGKAETWREATDKKWESSHSEKGAGTGE